MQLTRENAEAILSAIVTYANLSALSDEQGRLCGRIFAASPDLVEASGSDHEQGTGEDTMIISLEDARTILLAISFCESKSVADHSDIELARRILGAFPELRSDYEDLMTK